MNKLYCPKCEYEIIPTEEDIEDMETFCQNCLAYSTIKMSEVEALAEKINTNVERMEQSQRVDPETMNLTFSEQQSPRVCVECPNEFYLEFLHYDIVKREL